MKEGVVVTASPAWFNLLQTRARLSIKDYFLRWRILARIRRFLRPTLRLPLPLFLTPTKFILQE